MEADITSLPEPSSSAVMRRTRSANNQPGPSEKRPRSTAPAREPSIIELTDSDHDTPARPSQRNRRQLGPSQAAPAKTSNGASIFGDSCRDIFADSPASVPGSSQLIQSEWRGDGGPLFLPGDDDEPLTVHPLLVPIAWNASGAALARPQSPSLEPVAPRASAPIPIDTIDGYLIRVLEIVPDVQPAHALSLIEQFMQSHPANTVEFVLHALFEDPSYPRIDQKGKRKRNEQDGDHDTRDSVRSKVDYTSKGRVFDGGPHYFECSLEQLMKDFPRIPKPYIRSRLLDIRFYAPTYLLLAEELKKDPLPFKLKLTNSVVGKGKTREDSVFSKEREWILLKVAEQATEQDAALASSVNQKKYENNGEGGIECGCCFSEYPFDQMIQCPEAHLFCKSCMSSYASNLIGECNPNLVCMDQSGCKLSFPESELGRFLSPKLLELYYRVKQRKEIEAAGLENLEECPFCEYKCVIENEMEKLFRCENAECSAITCRTCKKLDHLPKTCKELEEDGHLDAQHVVEEAMTQALMRNCPKCRKSFIKEMGCNKMTCPYCHTVSCYICRKVINGYEHFSNRPPNSGKVDKLKCSLWDPVEQRHEEEVSEAAKRAFEEIRKSHPDVNEADIKIDIPMAKRPVRRRTRPPPRAAIGLNGGAALPAYIGPHAFEMGGGPGVPFHMGGIAGGMGGMMMPGMGMGMGMGGAGMIGAGMGAPLMGLGEAVDVGNNNPFVFGAGQAHQFIPPGLVAPRPLGLDPHGQAHRAVIPGPAPAAPATGGAWLLPPPPLMAPPVMRAGDRGRGRRRKHR